ncbi:MAG: signal peptidase I [bacterium]|nr:signal peptidase I [bacterium]
MPEEKKESTVWEFVKVIAISILIVIPIRTYVAQPFIVEGSSMETNYHNGEYLIIDELTYAFRPPQRGEVIIFRYPLNPSEFFIKRIIGLPGETVEIKNSKILINNIPMNEQYLPQNLQTGPDQVKQLPANQYFVMGDNRTASSDSRIWGLLPKSNITGRVLLRLWPINRAGIVKEPQLSYK